MITPPFSWLSQVRRFKINPPSCTTRTFFTFTKPVSVSTSTSANCTPPVLVLERPRCHWPCATRGFIPSFLHALDQFTPRASATPVCCCKASSALVQASSMAGETEGEVLLPPLPPDGGKFVSPTRTVICSGLSPNTSAAISAMYV